MRSEWGPVPRCFCVVFPVALGHGCQAILMNKTPTSQCGLMVEWVGSFSQATFSLAINTVKRNHNLIGESCDQLHETAWGFMCYGNQYCRRLIDTCLCLIHWRWMYIECFKTCNNIMFDSKLVFSGATLVNMYTVYIGKTFIWQQSSSGNPVCLLP